MNPSNPESELQYEEHLRATKNKVMEELVRYVLTGVRDQSLSDFLIDPCMGSKPETCYIKESKAAEKLTCDTSLLNLTPYQEWADSAFFCGMFNYSASMYGESERLQKDFYDWWFKNRRAIHLELYKDLLKKRREEWMKQVLAFAMGCHKRLGKKSLVFFLDRGIIERIAMFV